MSVNYAARGALAPSHARARGGGGIQILHSDPAWYTITSKEQLELTFANKPKAKGLTPLKANLQLICQGSGGEVDTLVLVLTDGEPSDCKMPDIQQMLQARSKSVYMSFLMCTHEDEVVEHYNKCVDPIWGCDITDDYVSERKECERNGNKLSQYKWMAKSVLGGKMGRKYDALDEKKVPAPGEGGCCVIS